MTSTSETELKIIEAAIAAIEKHGIQGATVRRIAEQAGVNVAAINYYFRTKDQLMERVMETTLKNAFDWDHYGASENAPPKQRLAAILDHLTAGAQAYPEISRAHFIAPIMEQKTDALSYVRFQEFLDRLYDDLVARGAAPGERLRDGIIQATMASILGIGLMLDLCAGFAGRDLTDPEFRRAYIDKLVDGAL